MRVLGIGEYLDLGAMYLDLARAGHEVRAYVGEPACQATLAGLVTTVKDWRSELAWVRDAGGDGFVVFETASHGGWQQELRDSGLQVIGGSRFGDRLEGDRAFGQQVMHACGMQVTGTHEFNDFHEATAFVRGHPGRYVYKPSGNGFASGRTFVGEMPDGADLLAYLRLQSTSWPADEPVRLVLMDRLEGVEVGVGAYFDGDHFLLPACLDWEHKRFFPGDLGELTGEMGTLVTYRGSEPLFDETLRRMEGALREGRYRGYINVNTIVDEAGVHPLELTCRFGYPGFAILAPLQTSGWADLFRRMEARGAQGQRFATADGFCVGVVLTVPPFPYATGYERLSKGLPVLFRAPLTEEDHRHLHFGEVALAPDDDPPRETVRERPWPGGQLITCGMMGYTMVVTGCGPTAEDAQADAYARVAKICLPNGRYRRDIGDRFIARDRALLARWGWLKGD